MILLLDNYDSFTYNLSDYFLQAGAEVEVLRNDACTPASIVAMHPEALVISPGPGRPEDAGCTMDAITLLHNRLPILGICLGYQAIGICFGARLRHAGTPVHGKVSQIRHNGDPVFAGIPHNIAVMRYHSLMLNTLPACLEVIAETRDAEPMAIKHRGSNVYGFQFHPESVLTEYGLSMLQNWLNLIRGKHAPEAKLL